MQPLVLMNIPSNRNPGMTGGFGRDHRADAERPHWRLPDGGEAAFCRVPTAHRVFVLAVVRLPEGSEDSRPGGRGGTMFRHAPAWCGPSACDLPPDRRRARSRGRGDGSQGERPHGCPRGLWSARSGNDGLAPRSRPRGPVPPAAGHPGTIIIPPQHALCASWCGNSKGSVDPAGQKSEPVKTFDLEDQGMFTARLRGGQRTRMRLGRAAAKDVEHAPTALGFRLGVRT